MMLRRYINDVKKYYKYAIYAGKAELKSEVAQSHLSWLWWILDPLLFMLVYTFVSLMIFGKSEKYFSAFIFIGYTSFGFFEKMLKASVHLVKSNKAVIMKVFIPKHILLLAKMYVIGFKSVISYVLVVGAMLIYRVPLSWHMIQFVPLLVLLVLVTYGFCTILMHFGVFVDDLGNVIHVGLRLLFYMSGVFYSFQRRLDSQLLITILLKWNPMAYIIDQMRNALLYQRGLDWQTYLIWLAISILLSIIGLRLVYKNENGYVKVI